MQIVFLYWGIRRVGYLLIVFLEVLVVEWYMFTNGYFLSWFCVSFVCFDSESEVTFIMAIHIALSYYLNALTKKYLLSEKWVVEAEQSVQWS